MNEIAPDPPPMVLIEDVTRIYPMGEEEIHALDGVTLRVDPGETVAFLGPSGSGKSTLMHLIGALDRPTGGRIQVNGRDLAQLSSEELAGYRNREVGFVFQAFHLQAHLTAWENVELPLKIAGVPRKERRQRAEEILAEVGLANRVRHLPSELSGGQRQRVSLARALVHRPTLLLADEPTGNLDSKTGAEVMRLLLRLHDDRNTTLLVVTHDERLAAGMGRTIRMMDGRLEGAVGPAGDQARQEVVADSLAEGQVE